MRRLWIADVHANLPALEAVLADAGGVDEVVFLGDIVGYGAHPAACVDLLRHCDAKAISGNHDTAVLRIATRKTRRSSPVDWDEWTFDQLNEGQLAYLSSLPTGLPIDSGGVYIQAMHHLPGAPYLHPAMPDTLVAHYLQAVPYPTVFCGHSHRWIDRTVGGRRYVCIPPVGQPRNGDTRAGYAIETDGVLAPHFVAYDVERVVAAVQNVGLEDAFCQRWVRFLRTASDPLWSREYKHEEEQDRPT